MALETQSPCLLKPYVHPKERKDHNSLSATPYTIAKSRDYDGMASCRHCFVIWTPVPPYMPLYRLHDREDSDPEDLANSLRSLEAHLIPSSEGLVAARARGSVCVLDRSTSQYFL